METVVILKGAASRGKTQTLKMLINRLIAQKGASIVDHQGYMPDETTDCEIILDVPAYGRVGVVTNGDPGCEQAVEATLQKFFDFDCKAVIGASRTKDSNYRTTVYALLWGFGSRHNAKTVETTTIVSYPNFGRPLSTKALNAICAANLENLLYHI